jgi:hypothetical protein
MAKPKQEPCDDCGKLVPASQMESLELDSNRRWLCTDCYLDKRKKHLR